MAGLFRFLCCGEPRHRVCSFLVCRESSTQDCCACGSLGRKTPQSRHLDSPRDEEMAKMVWLGNNDMLERRRINQPQRPGRSQ